MGRQTRVAPTTFKIKDRGKKGKDLTPQQSRKLRMAFREVKGERMPRKQKVAIALSKSRRRGVSIPLPR